MSAWRHSQIDRGIFDAALKASGSLDRRRLLISAAAFGASALLANSGASAQQAPNPSLPPPDTLHPSMRRTPGRYRPTLVKDLSQMNDLGPINQEGPYWNYRTWITPIEQFFIRNEFATPRAETEPRVDRRYWKLRIHGNAIERELTIGYEDLLKMPSRSIICTMECAGNGRSLFWEQQNMIAGETAVSGNPWGLGSVGQAEWQYVPMSHILGLVGLKPTAKAALFWSGVDNKENKPGAEGDRGRPLEISVLREFADVIGLAFKMNGFDLPADHGGPVRMIVPGYCGATSTKWVTEIKIADHNFWVPLNSVVHVMIGPDYPPPKPEPGDEFRYVRSAAAVLGPAVTWRPPMSLITVPLVLEKSPRFPANYPLQRGELPKLASGPQMVRGYAWAPRHGVRKVEYRIDGTDWQTARIEMPNMGRFTWVRFDFPWSPETGRHLIETRVTDTKGATQPDTVPFNRGGFNNWAIPKFHIDVVSAVGA
jgi:sulfane dehydrogenase subunit SoxC